ncbi:hypothetical protein [Streptomyces sp. NPDC092952]|uniref:hypothetical protein n=1 Tax=Streptomyces sp. NPDC092952 TaxID=3366018 RepID=UPI0037FABFB4
MSLTHCARQSSAWFFLRLVVIAIIVVIIHVYPAISGFVRSTGEALALSAFLAEMGAALKDPATGMLRNIRSALPTLS